MANSFAWVSLALWLPVTFFFFSRFRPATAAAASFVGASLFLPQGVDYSLPGVPNLDKEAVALLWIVAVGAVWPGRRWLARRPGPKIGGWLCAMMVVGAFATALGNPDPLAFDTHVSPGLTPYEGYYDGVVVFVTFGLPFFVGRALFRTSEDLRGLCIAIAIGALTYAVLMPIELRLSPQLHNWTYGFMPNQMLKLRRWGGYRPVMFMESALAVATFMSSAAVLSGALVRARVTAARLLPPGLLFIAVLAGVAFCKSVASMIYAAVFCSVVVLASIKRVGRVALLLCLAVVVVIATRLTGTAPTDSLVETAREYMPDRAQSLEFRFVNEDMLRDKALERPAFGWGGHGRNRVYNEFGQDESVTDGFWMIQLGKRGFVGLVGAFGLLLLPILVAVRRIHRIPDPRDRMLLAGLCLYASVRAVDLIPNGWYSGLPLLVAGALTTLSHTLADDARRGPIPSRHPVA